MGDRKEYELTQAQHDAILAASQLGKENAESAWDDLGRELGFKWLTVKSLPEKGKLFFTAESGSESYLALITPCPVCYSIEECPHTPVRCRHRWWYGEVDSPAGPWRSPGTIKEGAVRTCELCKRKESAVVSWQTAKI